MPLYRVLEKTYLQPENNRLAARVFDPGEEIDYVGVPNLALEPLDAAARKAKAASIKANWRTPPDHVMSQIFRLAVSLGARSDINKIPEAREFIDGWLSQNAPAKQTRTT